LEINLIGQWTYHKWCLLASVTIVSTWFDVPSLFPFDLVCW
jgi:hypothetical protein